MQYTYKSKSRTTEWRIRTGRSKPRRTLQLYKSNVTGEDLLHDAQRTVKCFRIRLAEDGIDLQDAQQECALAAIKLSFNPDFTSPKWRRQVMWNRCRDLCKLAELRRQPATMEKIYEVQSKFSHAAI